MNYYLATTAISYLWDFDSKVLLLGPWCLSDKNRKILEKKDYLLINTPWETSNKLKDAANYCQNVYEEIIPELAEVLNNLHSVSYPEKYWRILVGPWLLQFIEILYERFIRIEQATKYYPRLYTHIIEGDYNIAPEDTLDFSQEIEQDNYNLKLFSFICSFLNLACKSISIDNINFVNNRNKTTLKQRAKKILTGIKKLLGLIANSPVVLADMYHLKTIDYVLLSMKTGYRLFHHSNFLPFTGSELRLNYSPDLRKKLLFSCTKEPFKELLSQAIPKAIPKCYIEGYNIYKKNIPLVNDSVKAIGSAIGWYNNEAFKFYVGEYAKEGTPLIGFQHGGGYGMWLAMPVEFLEIKEKDRFYSWGWESQINHEKLVKLPSPHLSKIKDSYAPHKNVALFIGVCFPPYHYRFHTAHTPESFISYIEDKKIFFKALPENIKKCFYYRPYFEDYGWREKEAILSVYPQIKFLLKGKIIKWMKHSKITIIDHPHTSFIEALAINVPSIFYWDHTIYKMRPEAEEYFELLRKAGILYNNPIDAAKKLLEVFDNPIEWWSREELQQTRNIFLGRFGYSRKDWMDCWAKEIRLLGMMDIKNAN